MLPLMPSSMAVVGMQTFVTSPCGSGGWLRCSRHLIAHALQPPDELALHLVTILPLEKHFPFFLILLPSLHHVIVDHQNTMSHRQCRPFTASPFFQTTIAFSQVGVRAAHPMGGLHQRRSYIPIAWSGSSTESFACTFLLPRAHASP